MKNKQGGARKSGQVQRQRPHCSHQNLGQHRGRNCEYRQSQRSAARQPVRSIISSVLLGIQRLAQLSQQKVAMISRKSELLSNANAQTGKPPLELKPLEEGVKQLEERNPQLTTKNEKTQITAVRQR